MTNYSVSLATSTTTYITSVFATDTDSAVNKAVARIKDEDGFDLDAIRYWVVEVTEV